MAYYRKFAGKFLGNKFFDKRFFDKSVFESLYGKKKSAREEATWQSLCNDLDQLCQTIIFGLRIDSHDLQQVLVASLYIKILSNFQAVLLLLEKELLNESKTLLRGMMEAMFALVAISKDASVAQRFIENDHTQRMKLSITYEDLPLKLKRSLKPKVAKLINSSLNGMARPNNKPHDISPLTVEHIAKIADLEDIHYSVYTLLSGCNYLRVYELEQYWNSNRAAKSLLTLIYPDNRKSETVLYTAIKTIFLTLNGIKSTFDLRVPKEYSVLIKQFRDLAARSRNKPRPSHPFAKRKRQAKA